MKNSLDYQKEYDRDYYEKFLGSQNAEKDGNFSYFWQLIVREKKQIGSVCDVGCGKGGFLRICKEEGVSDLNGVDVSKYALNVARKVGGAKLYPVNLERVKLPFGDRKFDLVAAIDIVEHVKNSDNLFSEMFRVLKKGGLLFVTTENTGSLFSFMFSPFFKSHTGHINLQSEREWIKIFEKHGFSKIKSRGIVLHGFPPLLNFRNLLRKVKIPVIARPIVFPARTLTGTLVISATKA